AVDCDSDGPLNAAVGEEEAGHLQALLGRLPYEQREIIVLHLHQEMRFREIAQALGISINTVQSRYRYGLDKLRSVLEGVSKVDRRPEPERKAPGHEGRSRRCWFYRRCRPTKPWGFAAGRSQSNF
ncbi:MAG: sigma-70 family RNA polymerase sigma factor, partial [Planctomycetes bacterium]|nr:sigma-70 family RNA polymerase sigma factor [Planctomycetota bacterium]